MYLFENRDTSIHKSKGKPSVDRLKSWGLDPAWSRMVDVSLGKDFSVNWHTLDNGAEPVEGTIVCVHGNPTWSYIWRDVLKNAPKGWRVVAVDQTNMGFSQRQAPRRLEERVRELAAFCRQHVSGPVVLMAHDWGGPVAVGASKHIQDVVGVVLSNTAVGLPDRMEVPGLIRVARKTTKFMCQTSSTFVRGTAHMADRHHRDALIEPYRTAGRREGIYHFVEDIPVTQQDPSWDILQQIADQYKNFDGKMLLVWGGGDPVFHEGFLGDLIDRRTNVDVHVFENTGHLVTLQAPFGDLVGKWVDALKTPPAINVTDVDFTPVTSFIVENQRSNEVIYNGPGGAISVSALHKMAHKVANNLLSQKLLPQDRVALLTPLSPQTLAVAYGVWLAGGTLVVVEPHVGFKRLKALLRSATPRFAVVDSKTGRIAKMSGLLPHSETLMVDDLLRLPTPTPEIVLPALTPEMPAVVVHTSGATGPPKPVLYTHQKLAAQRNVLSESFNLGPYTTSFGLFGLLAPSLGVSCRLPADLTPNRLMFPDFQRIAAQSTMAWLSPQAAKNIVSTSYGRKIKLDLVMLAGAPVDPKTVQGMMDVTGADVRSPYGMTEALPLTDGSFTQIKGLLGGFCTGKPLDGVTFAVKDIVTGEITDHLGELVVSCPWMYQLYDRRWGTTFDHTIIHNGMRFHRTGDYGYLQNGKVFQLGRVDHIIHTNEEAIGCVAVEQQIQPHMDETVVAVGVGPKSKQQIVVVVGSIGKLRFATFEQIQLVRESTPHHVAAVLQGELPTDKRHGTKIDRTLLSHQATRLLEGK